MIKNNSINKSWWLPAALVLACLIGAYWSIVQQLVEQWLSNEDYSHGLLIVPIAVYLIWERREELKSINLSTDWRALPVLIFAIFVFIVGELGAELFTARFSMLLFVVGLTWLLFGFQILKILSFPLAFLFLMLPLPGFIYRNITFPLQLFSSAGAVELMHTLGVSAYREGNVIDVGHTQLQVVEACNGLRFILPLLTVGILMAYFALKITWKRMALVLATVPVAIFANIFRIAGTGIIGEYWGSEVADGFFHSFSGWVVFMLSVSLFVVLTAILRYLPGKDKENKKPKPVSSASGGAAGGVSWTALLTAVALILMTPLIVGFFGNVPAVALKKPLADFPLTFEGRTGRKSVIPPEIWQQVGGQAYVNIQYFRENEAPIDFYVAYYEYQRKGGDFIHSPKLCLPGAGWFIEKNSRRQLKFDPHGKGSLTQLKFNELVIQKGSHRQLSYYWYQGRGRNYTSEYAAKFYMVWDGMWRRRTDGALVRLITPLLPGISIEEARRTLDRFALSVSSSLEDYLP